MSDIFVNDYDLSHLEEIRTKRYGFNLFVTPRFKGHYVDSVYEETTALLMRQNAKGVQTFIDIGAHYGFFDVLVGLSNPRCRILAFEPVLENCEILKKNLAANNVDASIYQSAVSDQSGYANFQISRASDNSGLIANPAAGVLKNQEAKIAQLDQYLDLISEASALIKIDAEGNEFKILDGMQGVIEKCKDLRLVVEFNPACLEANGITPKAFLDKLDYLDFDIFVIHDEERRYEKYYPGMSWQSIVGERSYRNLFCIRKNRSLNVLLFSHSSGLHGAERCLLELVSELIQDYGALCTVYVPDPGPLVEHLESVGAIPIQGEYQRWCWWPGNESETRPEEITIQARLGSSLDWLVKQLPMLERISPDVIITSTLVIPWGAIAATLLNRAHLWMIDEFGQLDHGLQFYLPFSEVISFILASSNKVVTISKAVQEQLFGESGNPNVETIYYKVHAPEAHPSTSSMRIFRYPKTFKLIILGYVIESKGQQDAILAAIELIKNRGRDVELAVVGAGVTRYIDQLKRITEDARVEDRIHFIPFQENVYQAVSKADAAIVCSRNEAFGGVTVEAMLLGKAVIGTNSGGTPEIIKDGKTGLLYPPGNIEQLANQIERLIDRPNLRQVLAEKALRFVSTTFTPESFGGRYYQILADLKRVDNSLGGSLMMQFINRLFIHNLSQKDQAIRALSSQIVEKDQAIQALSSQIDEKDQANASDLALLQQREEQIANLKIKKADLQNNVNIVSAQLNQREQMLQAIYGTRAWRLMQRLWIIREIIVPHGGMLEKAAGSILDFAKKSLSVWKRRHTSSPVIQHSPSNESRYHEAIQSGGISAYAIEYQKALETAEADSSDSEYVNLLENNIRSEESNVKLIAFYLPQFYPIAENDNWWGKGFTEWNNVSKSIPQFMGHYQPHLPGELGFYDLRIPAIQRRQVELAQKYGIFGFCFYYYWFAGKRLLDRPLAQFMSNSEIDFPFCICWANENWTRRWDGHDHQVLIGQNHSSENDSAFINDIEDILRHKNYIRINGRPLLLVYRPQLLLDPISTADSWRQYCRNTGLPDPYLVAAQVQARTDPSEVGFDAAVEFPPNVPVQRTNIAGSLNLLNQRYSGLAYEYEEFADNMANLPQPPYQLFKTVFPAWDNTPRRIGQGTVFVNSTPQLYEKWLTRVCNIALKETDPEKRVVFINAWNEWAEGAHLEPDRRYGYAYLQATANALASLSITKRNDFPGQWKILFVSHDARKGGAQHLFLDIVSWFKKHTAIQIKILCLDGGDILPEFRNLADAITFEELQKGSTNQDVVLNRLVEFCDGKPDLIYGNTAVGGQAYQMLAQMGVPILTHIHELETAIQRYAGNQFSQTKAYTSHFIAVSNAVRENLLNNHGIDPHLVSVVYGGITPSTSMLPTEFEKISARKRLGLEQDKFLVFGCGMGMPFRKGADLFIETARRLRDTLGDGFHFYWIGDFNPEERDSHQGIWAEYLETIQDNGLDRIVTFLGMKENPREFLRAGDVFLLTSREDPFPLVMLEAAECGLPVICFESSGGAAEFVGDEIGYKVPFEDTQAMADKVALLLEKEDIRASMSSRAREKVLNKFTIEFIAPHVLSICREVANQKPTVSVIVPNYNHASYLPARLHSIFNQSFRDIEVLILDDASSDNSLEVIEKFGDYADVRIYRNHSNSGSAFRQWIKGIENAKSDILWVAESDDRCELTFLDKLLPAFADPMIKLAYANSHVINEKGEVVGDYVNTEYLMTLSPTKWKTDYTVSANREINDGLGIKNTILNASAVLVKKCEINDELRNTLSKMHMAGDWYFFVHAIKSGDLYYKSQKLNYHRRHSGSVIGKTIQEVKAKELFAEMYLVHEYVVGHYDLNDEFEGKWEAYMRQQLRDFLPGNLAAKLEDYYPYNELKELIQRKSKGPTT